MNLYSVSILLFSFGVLLVAILALVKRKDHIAVKFLFFSIAVCGWGFFEAFWFSQNYSRETTLMLARISNASAIWIPITWFHFVMDFIGKKEPVKHFYFLNYFTALFLTVLSQSPLFISGMHSILGFKYYTTPGPVYHLFTGVFFFLVPFGFTHLIKAYRTDSNRREQLKYFIMATVVGFVAGSTTFLPVYNVPFPLVLLPFMIIYPVFMGIGLIRYGLFDVQQIADAFQREKLAAIGTMAASLNHELRNPLYIAKGRIESYLDSAREGIYKTAEAKQENAEKALAIADVQLKRAMDIIQRFSDFARPFNNKRDREKVVLKEIVQNVLELVSHEFEMQKIQVRQDVAEGASLYVNRRQLEEILFNLILNACQAIKQEAEGGKQEAGNEQEGSIRISAEQTNGQVRIAIADNGPGISEENQRRIFEPFFSTKAEKGSGLGLYITKQLVEKNGGKISVKSKVGKGTSFILEFKR